MASLNLTLILKQDKRLILTMEDLSRALREVTKILVIWVVCLHKSGINGII